MACTGDLVGVDMTEAEKGRVDFVCLSFQVDKPSAR